MVKKGEFNEGQTPEQENLENSLKMTHGIRGCWHNYTIFWYRPEGSQTYRVIYGDLSVQDVAQEDLPK